MKLKLIRNKTTKKCIQCGIEFQAAQKNCNYCSVECFKLGDPLRSVPKYLLIQEKNKDRKSTPQVDNWIAAEQGKHFCQCGCGEEIIIKALHRFHGIPKYIYDHRYNDEDHVKEISETMREKMSGENSPSWEGGSSHKEYCYKFNKKCRENNRKKFGNKCFLCGNPSETRKLSVHHVDYNKNQGCDSSNWKLVPLCGSCHSKTNGKINKKYYEHLFSTLLMIREIVFDYSGKIDYRSIGI